MLIPLRPYLLIIILTFLTPVFAHANCIHPVSGAYYTSEVDLKVAARGVPMAWERTYRSSRTLMRIDSPTEQSYDYASPVDGPLGFGWHTPFTMRIWKDAPSVSDPANLCDAPIEADSHILYFPKDVTGAVPPDYANGYTLSATPSGWTLTQRGGSIWAFDVSGRLLTISDPLGRSATLGYDGDQLKTVSDSSSDQRGQACII